MLHLKKLRKNDDKMQGHGGVLVIYWMNTWMVDGVRGGVLWISSSPLDWSSGASWSQNEDIFIIQMEENHKRFRIFYLLKEEREDLLNYLSEMLLLLLLKIGLGTSSSCDLLPWWVTSVFSQWPCLSEMGHHCRYLVYRLAEHSGSAGHFCWWLGDECHHPVQIILRRYKWRTL